jgi:hypothetical protein
MEVMDILGFCKQQSVSHHFVTHPSPKATTRYSLGLLATSIENSLPVMRSDVPKETRDFYLEKYNKDTRTLEQLAKYFANARDVSIVKMTDLDSEGFNLACRKN